MKRSLHRGAAAVLVSAAMTGGVVAAGPGVVSASTPNVRQAWNAYPTHVARSGPPVITAVTADTRLDQEWRLFGDRSGPDGWAGSDGTYSTPLPDGRDAWLMNDTFLGPVNSNESLPSTAGFIHNSLVLATPRSRHLVTTVTGGTAENPQSLVGPTPNPPTPGGTSAYWYWNTDGIVEHGRLYVFESRIGPTSSPPPWNFAQTGMAIATFSLPSLRLESVTPTYGGANVGWGVQLLKEGPWTYIYGVESGSDGKDMHLARVRDGDLLGAWQFYTGSGWSSDPESSVSVVGGIGSSYGVTRVGDEYVLSTTDSYLDPQIYLYSAPTPEGPFTNRTKIYTPPEAGGNIYTYNVAAHPELTSHNQLVLSYNVNSFSLSDLYANINNNRPRFITVTFDHAG